MFHRILTTAPIRIAAVLGWLGTVATGLAMLSAYANTPGAPAHAPLEWPVASTIGRHAGTATVLVFAHPSRNRTDVVILSVPPDADEADALAKRLPGGVPVVILTSIRRIATAAPSATDTVVLAKPVKQRALVECVATVTGRAPGRSVAAG